MTTRDTPYSKINAGLTDAVAYATGYRTKGRRHDVPVSEADRQARAAFKAYTLHYQQAVITSGYPVEASPRTLDRIFAGRRDVPPGIARELAAKIRADTDLARHPDRRDGWADALDLWADDCQQR